MKITPNVIKDFELTQQKHGTCVALSNILWELGYDLMKDAGVVHVKTSYAKNKTSFLKLTEG